MEKYLHSGGRFGNIGGQFINIGFSKWEEWHRNQKAFDFVETKRDPNWITLYDASRDIWVALPVGDGKSYLKKGNSDWTELYHVRRELPKETPSIELKIITAALGQVGMIDYSKQVPSKVDPSKTEPFGWQHLGNIFLSGARKKWPETELKRTWRPGNKDWCGIFGTYCFQLAGVNAIWSLNTGQPSGSIQKVVSWGKSFKGSRKAFEASIKPGDMAVISQASQHFIVVSVDIVSGTMETVDGNQEGGRILKRDDHKPSEVVAYYRYM
jgi:hypothetical protein